MRKRKIVCLCEHEFEIDYPDFVDLEQKPEIEEDILSGDFMSFTCPGCGKKLKPEFPVHFIDLSRGIDYFLIPELDRGAFFQRKLDYKTGNPERVVIGFYELIEKLNIKRAGLDDMAVEILKFYLLHKAVSEDDAATPRIYFRESKEDTLIFRIFGLSDDKIGTTRIPVSTYDKVKNNLLKGKDKRTLSMIISPPYVSIRKLEWEKIL